MRTPHLTTPLDGFVVHPVRTDDDRWALEEWLQFEPLIGIDTETAGLGFHDPCRLVQVASVNEAWVFDPSEHRHLVSGIVAGHYDLVAHHAAFDAAALVRADAANGGEHKTSVAERTAALMSVMQDTQILSHLIDPRNQQDGGVGHGLKPLCDLHLGAGAIDGQTALKARFKELGLTISKGFAEIDLWDEDYVRYAGLDAGLTLRLFNVLNPMVDELGLTDLAVFEHEVARICASMSARGMAVDLVAAEKARQELVAEELAAVRGVSIYGVENVNSTAQVAEALLARGHELTEKTDSGKWKVDKAVLSALDDPVARLVQEAKTAGKARASWVEPIIAEALVDGRVHPRIRPLGAKTGRMSVERFQQLPTADWRVRGCLVADPGHTLVAVDYSQVEVRVMAYLAGEKNLIEAFNNGEDIHSSVAARLYGADFTPAQRGLAKGAIFGKLYGAGPKRLAVQTGVSEVAAKQVMNGLDRSFPRLARWAATTVDRARFNGRFITTPTGRRLPVVRGFEYKVTNYITQATAADLFKSALLSLDDEGFGDSMLMVVHDEIIFQTNKNPAGFAADVVQIMSGSLGNVPIDAEASIAPGPSWGHLYLQPKDLSHG
jgi:DNA polymerase-1